MEGEQRRGRLGPAVPIAPAARVDKFEVFFDLVFVVSFFIITRATAADVTLRELLHALLVLAVLWWCWIVHSVVASRLRLGEGFVPVLMVIGMMALFTFALALPQTFDGLHEHAAGPILVTLSYVVIRAVHLALYAHATRGRPSARRKLYQFIPEIVVTTILLFVAALVPPMIKNTDVGLGLRDGLWVAVVLIQYASGLVTGTRGWEVTSAEHWTERYDLILIIALGESVISVGVGGNLLGKPVTWPAIPAAMMGILFTAALWWAHFDMIGPAARIALHSAQGRPRVAMARDAYAYLYLPMIAGVILFAIGAEELVRTITDPAGGVGERGHGPAVPLLFAGVMVYLAADMAFQWRTLRTMTWTRVGVLLALAAGLPVAEHLPALAALGLLTAICVALVAVELVLLADARHALRGTVFEEKTHQETSEAAWRARWHDGDPEQATE
ncbi:MULTISPECIES: low temperature requirement protein A [Micromonospora]|uniref:Low temperature requirement protein A n=1 Tax=Micromonospora solifontis TaxID=2487138 RepID=A0ABX9WAM7_9ACTN|nr:MULTISPECIES: low temperature requirement protein A [Micromonospora]NES13180.1 low temperature requirement protein A [Micromonospora sp. PPF5-17B]NES39202.1 low temperature requirement protein A [Micromonospora solifontis]RNL90141.1 low temperature requirement protein A [Micromonospora solifontis]